MPPGQNRGSKKKGKGKEKTSGEKDEKDDLDRALEELSIKCVIYIYICASCQCFCRYPELKQSAQASKTRLSASGRANNEQNSLLAVSLAHLDSEAEMRKFFGSKVVCPGPRLVGNLFT